MSRLKEDAWSDFESLRDAKLLVVAHFVCLLRPRQEWCPSLNLKPDWANVCIVTFGGKKILALGHACACED